MDCRFFCSCSTTLQHSRSCKWLKLPVYGLSLNCGYFLGLPNISAALCTYLDVVFMFFTFLKMKLNEATVLYLRVTHKSISYICIHVTIRVLSNKRQHQYQHIINKDSTLQYQSVKREPRMLREWHHHSATWRTRQLLRPTGCPVKNRIGSLILRGAPAIAWGPVSVTDTIPLLCDLLPRKSMTSKVWRIEEGYKSAVDVPI